MYEPTAVAAGNSPHTAGNGLPDAAGLTALREYAMNPAFRSAEGNELLFTDNPFHRPVRANDLAFVQFDRPLAPGRLFELSALMGQRMLLNLYETSYAFVCDRALSAQAKLDYESFYDDRNRPTSELVRPILERHLFSWLNGDELVPGDSLEQLLEEQLAHGIESALAAVTALTRAPDQARMARFAALQLVGPSFSTELAIGAWSCVDWSGRTGPVLAACAETARAAQADLMSLSIACALPGGPHAAWQFYLGSWMGTANYIHRCTRDPRRLDEALGAILFDRLRFAAISTAWREMLFDGLATPGIKLFFERAADRDVLALRGRILDLLSARAKVHGAGVIRAAAHGIIGMRQAWGAADDDLSAQCAWAGQIDHHREVAARYMELIRQHALHVAMETYDEPSTERSTTHVHDTDRLLVIDIGEMDFWHSYGPPVHLVPGDMVYVPRHRLHGSVVTTERCVYHQPVITAGLAAIYAELRL